MANYVISAHGARKYGTSTGTYLVPKGVTIYFFQDDHVNMYTEGSDAIFDALCCDHPDELTVRALIDEKNIHTQYKTIPNYYCEGDDDFRDDTGVYQVGRPISDGPFVPIPDDGKEYYLSELIGGQGKGGVLGSVIYWLCCRAAPSMRNVNVYRSEKISDITLGGANYDLAVKKVMATSGLKPSQVKATGRWRVH